MGPARHAAPARLGFLKRDVETQFLQAGHQPRIPVAARRLLVQHPRAEIVEAVIFQAVVVQEVAQQVHRMSVQFGGEFDSANQFHSGLRGGSARLIVAFESIVVRDAERSHAGANRLLNQLTGRTGAVGFVSVRVQIDQRKPDPNVPV